MNIHRQSRKIINWDRIKGASAVPRGEAELKIPVGVPRLLTGYQLLTTRAAEGNCGASPMPRHMRAAISCAKLVARPPAAWAIDQTVRPAARSRRGPTRS